jgi:SAM-dependent methyltransferase
VIAPICNDLSFNADHIDPFDIDNPNLWVKLEHLGRYLFAADYLRRYRPQRVADIACGSGYGLPELTQIAQVVVALDQSAAALVAAQHTWENDTRLGHGQISFLQHDLERDPWPQHLSLGSLDAIASFETLEHLIEPEQALAKFSQALQKKGFLICSVPNRLHEPPDRAGLPTNLEHKQLFSFATLRKLLERHGFEVVYRLGQAPANILYKRESQLLKRRSLVQRLGDFSAMHTPDIIQHLSYLLAYPTVEDVEGSYAIIVVAQKK